jgi:uncharacterized membrane protein
MEAHLAIEEQTIFPAIARALSPENRSALFEEMKARHGLQPKDAAVSH